jgi:hypothetical protein
LLYCRIFGWLLTNIGLLTYTADRRAHLLPHTTAQVRAAEISTAPPRATFLTARATKMQG